MYAAIVLICDLSDRHILLCASVLKSDGAKFYLTGLFGITVVATLLWLLHIVIYGLRAVFAIEGKYDAMPALRLAIQSRPVREAPTSDVPIPSRRPTLS